MSDEPVLEQMDGPYPWRERRFYIDRRAPEGKCWSVREMFSWAPELARFVPHLLAMGEGLEQARYVTYDHNYDSGMDPNDEDNYGIFVVGLRPRTAKDQTEADLAAARKTENELNMLAELLAKHLPDAEHHFVTFNDAGWFVEHSVACRLAGTLGTCDYNQAVAKIADDIAEDDYGRHRIVEVDGEGLPSLVRVEPVP